MKVGAKAGLVSAIGIYVLFFLLIYREGHQTYVLFKDVRQGDSILIRSGMAALLIDGGPSHEDFVFLPNQFCPISGILLTHPHSDHLVGLNRVLKLCSPTTVYANAVDYESRGYSEFQKLAKELNTTSLYRGDVFKLGDFTFYVLWPPKDQGPADNVNETSLVVLLDYGDFEALLTGDISAETQNRLNLAAYTDIIQDNIDVYKLPHHGSKHSYDRRFLLSLQPKTAVVSLGENSFGHPSDKFVTFFEEQEIPLYRTDRDGDIMIEFKKTL